MKIRIKDSFLRLSLTQTEVEHFGREWKFSSPTRIGTVPEHTLTYSLVKDSGAGAVSASFEGIEKTVKVPEQTAADWAFTNKVGFDEFMPVKTGPKLFILVEKNCRWLQERPHEDGSDAFPNPMEEYMVC